MSQQTPTSPLPVERSQAAVALDNLIRRHLRVSDPRDPEAISKALRERYVDERQALEQERSGLPFVPQRPIAISDPGIGSSDLELRQAKDDVDRDLQALMANASLKDIRAELHGWSTSIHQVVAEGTAAARFGMDPRQRDAAMSARRMLCGYARLARYVGALTPNLSPSYRHLAKSLDEVSAMILVLLGDAIANTGQGGARFLLQAPASELQGRRDAVIYALRNLIGTSQESYGPNDWPRGLVAYRQFVQRLEVSGHSDLRTLFEETYVARALDQLLHWSTAGTGEDLRALGSMSHILLERFRRLIMLAARLVDPESPPLAAYLSAIQLFLDAFEHGSSGARLLYIARPPIVFYGLYGMSGPDAPTARLIELVLERGRLANELDCYLGCNCSTEQVRCQIMLDKILYDVDRAIDLYALGSTNTQEPEQRAAAYGVLIDLLIDENEDWLGGKRKAVCPPASDVNNTALVATCEGLTCVTPASALDVSLRNIRDLLWWKGDHPVCNNGTPPLTRPWKLDAFKIQSQPAPITGYECISFKDLGQEVREVISAMIGSDPNLDIEHIAVVPPQALTTLIEHREVCRQMHQELCLQQAMEQGWVSLLRTMAPSCLRFNGNELTPTAALLAAAIDAVHIDQRCDQFKPDIPPHFETSLAGFTYWRDSEGGGES
ncbi:hypothetical protein ABC977_05345 [Thioalkalicoccus limnaeus]|uniref:Uncharacterized protein n=1 Tax=Thioalkalicoccus limnaeus TaxID=120681 RepID=A0ABV4BEX7_9GAMM